MRGSFRQVPRVAGIRSAFDYLGTHAGLRSLGRTMARVPVTPVAVITLKTDTFEVTSTTFAAVTGLSATITLSRPTKKVRVRAIINGNMNSATGAMHFRIDRDGNVLGAGAAAGNRSQAGATLRNGSADAVASAVIEFQDGPGSVGPHVYAVHAMVNTGSGWVNRSTNDTDDTAHSRTSSFISVIEED